MRRTLVLFCLVCVLLCCSMLPAWASAGHAQEPTPQAGPGQGEALRAECQSAAELGDYSAAADACRRALDAFRQEEDSQGEGAVLLGLGWLDQQLGLYQDSLASYEAALSLYRGLGDKNGEAQAQGGLCGIHYALGSDSGVSEACIEAAALFHEQNRLGDEATAFYVLGLALQRSATSSGDAALRAQAMEAYSQALPLFQAAGDRVGEAGILQGTGDLYTLAGDRGSALPYYLRALPIYQEVGIKSLLMVSLGAVASTYAALLDSQSALDYYEQALPLRREMGDRAGEASTLSGIGLAHARLRDYPEALAAYAEALAIWKELGNRPWQALVVGSMGDIYSVQYQYDMAQSAHDEALSIYRDLQDRRGEASALESLALDRFDLADHEGAFRLCEQVLSLWRSLGDRSAEASTQWKVAVLYSYLGLHSEALTRYQEALGIMVDLDDRAGQAEVLLGMASIHAGLSEFEVASSRYQQALDAAVQSGDPASEAAALVGLGWISRETGRGQEALDYCKLAWSRAEESGDLRVKANVLGDLGLAYEAVGDLASALSAYEQELSIAEELGDRQSAAIAHWHMAVLYLLDSDGQKAASSLRQALDASEPFGHWSWEPLIYSARAEAAAMQGDEAEALDYALRSVDSADQIYARLMVEELQSGFISYYNDVYLYAVRLALSQHRESDAFWVAERARARAFLSMLGNRHVNPKATEDAALVEREARARGKLVSLSLSMAGDAWPGGGPGELVYQDTDAELQAWRTEYAGILSELQLTNPEYASLVSVSPLTLEELQALLRELAPDVTLLSYVVDYEQVVVFVISAGEFHVAQVPVAFEKVDQQIEALVAEMKVAPVQADAWQAPAQALYAWLIKPIEQYLPRAEGRKAPRVGVIPHWNLHYLPFSLLHPAAAAKGKAPRLLGERYSLFYAPSASSLRFILSNRHAGSNAVLAMANPDAPGAPHLAHAVDEAEAVAGLHGGTAVSGVQASEARFKQEASTAGIIHLAAHSDMQPAAPLFSAILLQPGGADDGRLETHEIINLELPLADLVVLSACQTHLGELTRGDDLVGLERAFFRAGTPTLLTTLWPVDDEATAAFMTSFYTHLREGAPKAEALRMAQQETRQVFVEPYYWAGFVLVGDPGTVPPAGHARVWWTWALAGAAGLGLLALGVALLLRRRRAATRTPG